MMGAVTPLFPTKQQAAAKLAVGTWFVWPRPQPQRFKYYQPRVYQVEEDGKPGTPVYAGFGLWELTEGVDSPQAAFERAQACADALNARRANRAAAELWVQEDMQARKRAAMQSLSERLFGGPHR
jgi:hypothetical protein